MSTVEFIDTLVAPTVLTIPTPANQSMEDKIRTYLEISVASRDFIRSLQYYQVSLSKKKPKLYITVDDIKAYTKQMDKNISHLVNLAVELDILYPAYLALCKETSIILLQQFINTNVDYNNVYCGKCIGYHAKDQIEAMTVYYFN